MINLSNPQYTEIFYKLIKIGDNDITEHLYNFLSNCIIDCEEFAKFLFSNENFIRLCMIKYLEPTSSIKIDQNARKATVSFFVSLSKFSEIFNENQKKTFYKIFERLISVMQFDPEVLYEALIGLRSLLYNYKSEEKIVYNFIKNNNYTLFDKMFLSINELLKNGIKKEEIELHIYNISVIVNKFIALSDEKDAIILLQNIQLLNFI